SGGTVIVQVEYLAEAGSIHPKEVKIPGILVDYVVVATQQDCCWQAEGVYYEPSFAGHLKKPLSSIAPLPMSERKAMARRAAMELRAGDVVNLGVGIPADVANVVTEEGFIDSITLSAESGAVGGVPSPLPNFGSSYNLEASMTHGDMFDLIDGGGMDITILGMGEADQYGNVNVSRFGQRLTGPGGFINITQATGRIVFCGSFMNKAKYEVRDGRLVILEQGDKRKLVEQVEHITFSGKYAKPAQEVLYVTERCVFRLENGGLTLTEIAPGLELEGDILANMSFSPAISPELREMDAALFHEAWGRLGESIRA
ncbi:MAG: acyl CoA:acetate/3-ketoacid CoA transferase, partial [Oscillospiraceae bacterium]|nr:acyl CoA:acetate/3-ketoacid CoA transferase [Oscillospiraceae bacterium]